MIAAIIPFKRLSEAKSRLAGTLPRPERQALAQSLLVRTVGVLRESDVVDCIVLASPEQQLAIDLELIWITEHGGLNSTLGAAIRWSVRAGATSALIVPADLPLVEEGDIHALLRRAPPSPSMVLAPTRDGGTGALFLTPPDVIPPSFGPSSGARHWTLARDAEIARQRVKIPGFSHDLDTRQDLACTSRSNLFGTPDSASPADVADG